MTEDMQVRNLSPHTQTSYVQQVSLFARYFGKSPELLGPEEIRAYQVYLTNEKKLATSSILIAVSALRFLYKVTLHRDWTLEDIIPAPKKPQKLPVVLSPEEVLQFLDCIPGLKHRTILTTCYAAGLRISEVVHLKPPDIDSQRMVIRVEQGKGQKDRYVMLSPKLLESLRNWWRVAKPKSWLFPGDIAGAHISKDAVEQACQKVQRHCRIPKPITPHSLRHYAEFRTMPRTCFDLPILNGSRAASSAYSDDVSRRDAGFMDFPFNHFFNDRTSPKTVDVLTRGPLSPHLTEYAQYLHDAGYAIQSGQLQLRMLSDFSTWLDKKRLGADEVNWSTVERYILCRRKAGRLRNEDAAALARMLRMLRAGQAEAPASPATAQQIALEQFQHYLRQVRGLAEGTVTKYTPIVRAFLAETFSVGIPDFHQISAGDIARFVQHQAERITSRDAPTVVTALRSFLRHLLHYGAVDTDLAACVPTIATWSLSNVPKFLPAEQIQRVLDSCDRDTASGKRNYCILLLLARLGLRAGEVVALTLDDIDWEEGVVTVRGKGKRVAQMPLPAEVGAAIAVYLRRARPACSSRRVFIREKAPLVGFANSVAICSLVDRALTKAGVESAYRGSHLFRHSLATTMLKHGASLHEIGDLLRHRRPDTTAIYAKVDLVSLRSIALPWPGGAR
jgi:site-specific recombinase XerD